MHVLITKVLNQLSYIAWANYVDVHVMLQWAGGLALLGLVAWGAWGWGATAVGPRRWRSASERLLVTLPTALAIVILLLFVSALVGAYSLPVAVAIWAAGMLVPPLATRRWSAMLDAPRTLARSAREMPLTWAFLILVSIAALLPPTHWDEVGYHLPYPQQWVAARRLTVDPSAWYPFYTWNWELLQGVGLMLRSEPLIHLLGWLTGALTTVGVRVFAARLGVRPWLAAIAAAAFAITPMVQRYIDSGMIDVPLMCFFTATLYAFTLLGDDVSAPVRARDWLPAALCAGVFVGMKITGIVYIPLVAALAFYRLGRRCVPLLVVFALSAMPWYAYNFVRSGDPAPPLLSLALHRAPLYWNADDIGWHESDHARGRLRSVGEVVALPIRLVRRPPAHGLPPAPLYDGPLLGYILLFPFSILAIRAAWRRRVVEPMVGAWYGAAAFVATSTLLVRYATFVPMAIVSAAFLLDLIASWAEARVRLPRWWLGPVAAIALCGPFLFGALSIRDNLHWRIPTSASGREDFQIAIEPILNALRTLRRIGPPPATVYLTQNGYRYNYQASGYRVVGNDTHPGRFPDFRRALVADSGSRFLGHFGVDYLVVDKQFVPYHVGLSTARATALIDADPGFERLYDDSVSTIYRVRRPASVAGR